MAGCGRCHECGSELAQCLDGEEWCAECQSYRRYVSHGWSDAYEYSACLLPADSGLWAIVMHEKAVAYRHAEFPSLEKLLRRACDRILEGFYDIEEAKEHMASCPTFFDGWGFELKGA